MHEWQESAIKYGIPNAGDAQIATMLLNLAERDAITVSYGVVAVLVEAAARLSGDMFISWERDRRPVVVFS